MSKRMFATVGLSFLISLTSCRETFERDYYERISGIKFPQNIHVIETNRNGEFVTTTTLKVDSIELIHFVKEYKFEKKEIIYPSHFLGGHFLKNIKPDFKNLQNLYFKTGSKGKNSWFYVVDLTKSILWAEIQFPDLGGT